MGLFLFNPAVFANSAMWGQVDIIGTFFLLTAFYLLLVREKFFLAGIFAGLSFLSKPIFLLALPIFGVFFFQRLFFPKKKSIQLPSWLNVMKFAQFLSAILATIWLFSLPFVLPEKLKRLFGWLAEPFFLYKNLLIEISQRYPYSTVNAFNFWFLAEGKFWLTDKRDFLFFNLNQWGTLVVILFSVFIILKTATLFIKKRNDLVLLFSFVLLCMAAFLFLTRMHERHFLYLLPFLLIVVGYKKKLLIAYVILSLSYAANLYFALQSYLTSEKFSFGQAITYSLSLINVIVFFWLLYLFSFNKGKDGFLKIRACFSK